MMINVWFTVRGWDKSILTKENPNIAHQPRSGNILRFPREASVPPRAHAALRGITDAYPSAGVYLYLQS